MGQKSQQYRKQAPPPQQKTKKAEVPRVPVSIEPEGDSIPYLKWILAACVAIITYFTYHFTLSNEFTNWDDGLYVETNPYIKNLTPQNWKMILFHNITNNYYHPITMISIAWNYHYAKMEPHLYYLTNVMIHVVNSVVMFFLVLMLLEAMTEKGYGAFKNKSWYAAFGALCYSVHPMHVESVSWLAERKDVLYGLFYFLGLIAYIKYLKREEIIWIPIVVLCYACSLLSKPLAVVFPFSLFAIDVLLKRKNTTRIILEKLPFFAVSLGAGIWAWHAQKASGAVASFHTFSIWERLMFAAYGYTMYIAKAFVPIHLCSYYPYPVTDAAGHLPIIFYLAPFIGAIVFALPLLLAYKAGENYFRVVIFGSGFFLFNVIFVLQFVSSGPAIMADRYSYIAYFGIFMLVIYFIDLLIQKFDAYKIPLYAVMGGFTIMLAFLCYDRTKIWHSTETLWRDVIRKYPFRVETSYKNLGNYYAEKGIYDSAYANYMILSNMHSTDAGVYSNIGNIYGLRKQFAKSLEAYSHSLKLDSTGSGSFDTYLDRAITYSMMGQYALAIKDYNHAYAMDSKSEKLLENRAYTYLSNRNYDLSINDYNKLIQIDPDKPLYYLNRGIDEFNTEKYREALNDFLTCVKGDPQNKDALYDLALSYEKLKDYNNALSYAMKAKQAGAAVTDDYIAKLKSAH